jgi:hypothetical protein
MNTELFLSSTQSIQKYFDAEIQGTNENQLQEWLTQQIIYLLLNDMEKLLNILYRIDVNEKKVKEVFAQQNPQLIAPLLAQLLIDREMQKAQTRIKFGGKKF